MILTPGVRVYADEQGRLRLPEGGFGLDPRDGNWYARPHGHSTGCLSRHEVVEHEDGTITVSPSILFEEPPLQPWHGYLERGGWREIGRSDEGGKRS